MRLEESDNPLPLARFCPAVELRLTSREEAVAVGVLQKESDGGFDVMHKVRRLSHRRRGEVLETRQKHDRVSACTVLL